MSAFSLLIVAYKLLWISVRLDSPWLFLRAYSATVEYIAPQEYMVRPPQPCIYMFLIDVAHAAVSSGMVDTVCNIMLSKLDSLVGDKRTKIGFITYDHQLHFFNLKSTLSQPQIQADIRPADMHTGTQEF